MLSWFEALSFEFMRVAPFACDGPMNGGGGGGGKTSVELTSMSAGGEAFPLLLVLALFLAVGVWMFRHWGRPTADPQKDPASVREVATNAALQPSVAQ